MLHVQYRLYAQSFREFVVWNQNLRACDPVSGLPLINGDKSTTTL